MRLITYADIPQPLQADHGVSISLRHVLELSPNEQIVLLDDRGFGSSGSWEEMTIDNIRGDALATVGPDEPPRGRSREEQAQRHWSYLQKIAEHQGVAVDAECLRQLPHDVVLSPRLLALVPAKL